MPKVKQKFECKSCGTLFSSAYNLKVHIDSKCSTIKSFICEICLSSFQTIHSLKSHKKIHSEKAFSCSFCGKKFVSKGQCVIHERTHSKIKPFVCSICDKRFAHRESLLTHSTLHTKIKPYACENCNQTFSCIGNLIKHRKVRPKTCGLPKFTHKKITKRPEITTKLIQAEESKEPSETNHQHGDEAEVAAANISYAYFPEHRYTIQEVHIEDYIKAEISQDVEKELDAEIFQDVEKELDVKISQDGEKELDAVILQNIEKEPLCDDIIIEEHLDDCDDHIELQISDNDNEVAEAQYFDINNEQYCCRLCPKIYLKKNVIVKHLKNDHQIILEDFMYNDNTNNRYRKPQKNQKFTCKVCLKKFTSLKLADKHEMHHGEDGLLIYKCSCCPIYFETQLKMKNHQNSEHESRLTCNIEKCLRKFDHPEKLLSHKKYAHANRVTKKKNVSVCTLCGRSFNSRFAMMDHERSNCGSNPFYKCNVCDKKYSSSGILKCHMKIHTQELNFSCDYCPKIFRTKGQLVSHERTHSKDKPFKCQFSDCTASFSHRESLLTHHTTHSGIKRFECEACNSQFSCISNLMAHKRSRKQNKCGSFTQIQKVKNAKSTLKQLNFVMEK